MILLLVVVSSTLSGVALAQRPDTLRRDSIATRLLAVEVIESILPVVGLPQGVSVFLDSVPVNEPDAGQVNFDLLPLATRVRGRCAAMRRTRSRHSPATG
jgi:hypothetical protein